MTPAELRAYDYIREEIAASGYSPRLVDIGERTGVSTGAARRIVDRLVAARKLTRQRYRHRSLRLPDMPDLTAYPTEALRGELGRRGETFDAIVVPERRAYGRAVSCAADCCQIEVKRGMIFCRSHWFSLPPSLQHAIKRAFAAKDQAAYQAAFSEAKERIDRGDGADVARRRGA